MASVARPITARTLRDRIQKILPSSVMNATRQDWLLLTSLIAGMWLVTSLPYAYAYLSSPPDKVFMGIMLDVPDHGQYFSWMRELSSANLISNKLTAEPNAPAFFNLLWWILGRLGQVLGLDRMIIYQAFRLFAGAIFLTIAFAVCSYFLADRRQRNTALLIAALGSGLGWIWVVVKYTLPQGTLPFPLDVYTAEGNTFLGILAYPHFIAAACYVLVFLLFLTGEDEPRNFRNAMWGGVIALFLGWQHAYDLVLVYGVLGAYCLVLTIRDRGLPRHAIISTLIIMLLSFTPALYSVLLTSLSPTWKEVFAQFDNAGVFTPNLLHLPLLLGVSFLLALYTLFRKAPAWLGKLGDNRRLFLGVWFLANFVLIYLPTDFQIHLLNGWQIPISIIATIGWFEYMVPLSGRMRTFVTPALRNRLDRAAAALLVLLVLPTNIYLLAWRFVDLGRHDYPYYLQRDEWNALGWLNDHAQPDDVVLSGLVIGQYIPAWTGANAYLAHWAQTLDFYQKEENVNVFFSSGSSDGVRERILESASVDYVFYGPTERLLGDGDPATLPGLVPVYRTGQVAVFQVSKPTTAASTETRAIR